MSFGTFMDSLLFSVKADLGTLSGEVSHVLAPVTPDFVFEHRREKRAEALEKLSAYYSDEEDVQEFPAKCIVMPTPEELEENEKVRDEKEEKLKETVAIKTSETNASENVDEILGNLKKGIKRKFDNENITKEMEELIFRRIDNALEEAAEKDEVYQKERREADRKLQEIEQAGLTRKQWQIVDEAFSAHNSQEILYAKAAYSLGFKDGIRLIREISADS